MKRYQSEIALSQVDLAIQIENVKKVLENILSLFNKLCNPSILTHETSQKILSLGENLKILGMQLPQNLAQSEKHFRKLLQTQSQLATLIENEANIRSKLINIQTTLTLHMEILYKELGHAKTLLKKDPNLSTLDGLLHLAIKLTIQIKSLDAAYENQDATIKIILDVHKYFLEKYTISV